MHYWMIWITVIWAAASSHAAFGRYSDGSLDQKTLRKAYIESDFEKVRKALEDFRKAPPPKTSRENWIFTHKYLGVIYAADSTQTVRAESNFNQLLNYAPHIELADMFVPPKIQALFDRTKAQYFKDQEYNRRYDEHGNPVQGKPDLGQDTANPIAQPDRPKPTLKSRSSKKSRAWVWWTAVGAIVGVGGGYYIWTEFLREDVKKTEI